jgi:hypothetical protein
VLNDINVFVGLDIIGWQGVQASKYDLHTSISAVAYLPPIILNKVITKLTKLNRKNGIRYATAGEHFVPRGAGIAGYMYNVFIIFRPC